MSDEPAPRPDRGPAVLVVIGGDRSIASRLPTPLPRGCVVVAADSGLDVARAAGVRVHHVVGDLDSVDPAVLERARAEGTVVHRHPRAKAATDMELAVDLALDQAPGGPGPLLVVGPGGGRLDHELGSLLLLASARLERWEVTAHLGAATVTVVRGGARRRLHGVPREQVSLLPVHGHVRGVTTEGLRWVLDDAELPAGTSRGISNELVGREAAVSLSAGVLLVVQPGTVADPF